MSYQGPPSWNPGPPQMGQYAQQPPPQQHHAHRPPAPPLVVLVLWGATACGAALGLLFLAFSFFGSGSILSNTEQVRTTGAVVGLAMTLIPYCAARAASELSR